MFEATCLSFPTLKKRYCSKNRIYLYSQNGWRDGIYWGWHYFDYVKLPQLVRLGGG